MKKLIIILFSFISPIFNSGCLLEPDKEFVTDTLVVQVHDTTRIHDTTKIYKDTLFFHDTVRSTITKRDTLWRHDTIHDTTKTTVTITVHDTLKTFATNTNSSLLVGTWDGIVANQSVRLAFSTEVYPYTNYAFSFTANVGTKVFTGYIKSTSGNNATVDIHGSGAYGEAANWIFSITNNVISLQQTGYQMFPTAQVFTLNRIN